MKTLNWERLRIFNAVLESGSLAAAARRLRISQPTVSRQVRALENELGEALIDVTPDGALPTSAGLRLAPALEEMLNAAASIGALVEQAPEARIVRITCGPWMAAFLSRHLNSLLSDPPAFFLEIAPSTSFADLVRREADIAIRNQRPKSGSIKIKKLPDYAFAPYGSRRLVRSRKAAFDKRRFSSFNWAALAGEFDHLPSARMLASQLKVRPVARFSLSTNLLDGVKSGHVLALLPCFAGDAEKDLIRLGRPFVPDYGGHWLAMAEDSARRPHVRRAADCLIELLQKSSRVLKPDC